MNRFLALTCAFGIFFAAAAEAQVGIGGQVGDPTGLSIKAGLGRGAIMGTVGWDLDDSITAEVHYLLRERRLSGTASDVRIFYGPGVYLRSPENGDVVFGISLGAGLGIMVAREIEIYGLISPRLQLVEQTDFDLGGGIGARIYL